MEVATDKELHERIATMANNQQLNLGKNHFTFQGSNAEKAVQAFVAGIGEIKDSAMLPSCISIESEDAVACLETRITVNVSPRGENSHSLP